MTPGPSLDAASRADGTAPQSTICHLDAEGGRLTYRGYDVRDLVRKSTFEETAFLLAAARLPRRDELSLFIRWIRAHQKPAPGILRLFRSAPPGAAPMTLLRTAVSALPLHSAPAPSLLAPLPQIPLEAVRLIAQLPVLVAALHRIRVGQHPVTPRRSLSLAANFLYMLHGAAPDARLAQAFDAALIVRGDNEFNPSTFAARVAASTKADLYGCVTAGLATLAGPQHAGHTAAALAMLEEMESPDRVEGCIRERLASGRSVPAFGHPVYGGDDPRTEAARGLAQTACQQVGLAQLFATAQAVEERMLAAVGGRANVDFYLALLYRALCIPAELFTPVFAVGRVAGWVAHAREQYEQAGLIRPRAAYVGAVQQEYLSFRRRK